MNSLAVTIRPVTETEIGIKNVQSFINSGYEHLHVTPNHEAMRTLTKLVLLRWAFLLRLVDCYSYSCT